jgi:hypothetical protein
MPSYLETKKFTAIYLLSFSLVTEIGHAQVHAPSAKETTFSYEASFILESPTLTPEDDAALHLSHLFGIFKSRRDFIYNGLQIFSRHFFARK